MGRHLLRVPGVVEFLRAARRPLRRCPQRQHARRRTLHGRLGSRGGADHHGGEGAGTHGG